MGMTQQRNEKLLERLEVERHMLDEERQRLQSERAEVTRLQEEAQHLVAQAKQQEEHIRRSLYAEGQALLRSARQDIDATLATLRRQARTTPSPAFPQEPWQRVVQAIAALEPMTAEVSAPSPVFHVGDRVRVRGLNMVGRLATLAEGSETVRVEVGNKTVTVSVTELERLNEPPAHAGLSEFAGPQETQSGKALETASLSSELRLLGYTVAEALPVVDKYLDQAFVQKLPQLRIVHGVGSGRLREAITDLLGRHPLVRRFQAGDASAGTTIVELER
jgi:DNA mismatch repair protein MutS2